VVAAVACAPLGGCVVYDVASTPVKVAVGTAEVAGNVAIGTVKVAGSVAGGTIGFVAGLANSGAVPFYDIATNNVTRVPWQKGLTLAGASDTAKVGLAQHPVEIVRNGQVIYSAANGAGKNTAIAAGDVVQVGR
jgi:hypothetical protein